MSGAEAVANIYAVVPAAGVGARMGAAKPKQYLSLLGKTVLEHTLGTLLSITALQRIVVVVSPDDDYWRALPILTDPRIVVVEGGAARSQSVLNGIEALSPHCTEGDWLLVHDVARPCIERRDIMALIERLRQDSVGGILALPVSDTLKQVDQQLRITATVDRSHLWQAQTPQMFRYQLLHQALLRAKAENVVITDEASAIEWAGFSPTVVVSTASNIKITRAGDLALAAFILQSQQQEDK